jgi:biotin operon repressor
MRKIDVDSSSMMRCLTLLKVVMEDPEVFGKRDLQELLGVSKDTVRSYVKILREAGFNLDQSGYPDYKYYLASMESMSEKGLNVMAEYLTKHQSKRHGLQNYITVNRNGVVSFSPLYAKQVGMQVGMGVGFELMGGNVRLVVGAANDFVVSHKGRHFDRYMVVDVDLVCWLYDFFGVDMGVAMFFRLEVGEGGELVSW